MLKHSKLTPSHLFSLISQVNNFSIVIAKKQKTSQLLIVFSLSNPSLIPGDCDPPTVDEDKTHDGAPQSSYQTGNILNYSCGMGYDYVSGSSTSTCQSSGSWTSFTLTCQCKSVVVKIQGRIQDSGCTPGRHKPPFWGRLNFMKRNATYKSAPFSYLTVT